MSSITTTAAQDQLPAVAAMTGGGPIATLEKKFGPLESLVARRVSEAASNAIRLMDELAPLPRYLERAEKRLRLIPCRATLHEQGLALYDALVTPAPEIEVRAIVAAMLASIPSATAGASKTYVDAAVADLRSTDHESDDWPRFHCFSAQVIYSATRQIRRTAKFTPAISEILDAAKNARLRYWHALRNTNRLSELRCNAEGVVDALTDDDADEAELAAIMRGERADDDGEIPL